MGVGGKLVTATVVVPGKLVQPEIVTVTEYVPAMPVLALVLTVGSS